MNKKAVSPVIATLLMIAIAVAASILVYVWSIGLIGTLQTGGGQQTREQIELDAYDWSVPTGLVLHLRNVGSSAITVDAIYIQGVQAATSLTNVLNVQSGAVAVSISVPSTGVTYASGAAYTVKVVTASGGVFTFSCICGHAA